MIALAGLTAAYASGRSTDRMACVPAIMPTANTPTAIEITTSSVRILLFHRSRSTLRQRGLSTGMLLDLARVLAYDALNLIFGQLRFLEQSAKRLTVQRGNFHRRIGRRAHRHVALAVVHQRQRAEKAPCA